LTMLPMAVTASGPMIATTIIVSTNVNAPRASHRALVDVHWGVDPRAAIGGVK
jgi:hypothetical protein